MVYSRQCPHAGFVTILLQDFPNVMCVVQVCISGYRMTIILCVGHSLLHISWLEVALSRIFDHHEARSIIRWGVLECLGMELNGSPLVHEQHWDVSCVCVCGGGGGGGGDLIMMFEYKKFLPLITTPLVKVVLSILL